MKRYCNAAHMVFLIQLKPIWPQEINMIAIHTPVLWSCFLLYVEVWSIIYYIEETYNNKFVI